MFGTRLKYVGMAEHAAVIASGAVYHLGGAPAEQITPIDGCPHQAGRQICLSAKDESL